MSASRQEIKDHWWLERVEGATCPRCGSEGDDETGLFILVPLKFLHEMDVRIPALNKAHAVLCYPCAVEIMLASGAKSLIGQVSKFVNQLGHHGGGKTLP
jgi:hypothetical protein